MTGKVRIRPGRGREARRLAELRYAFRAEVDPPVEARDRFLDRCTSWMRERLGSSGSRWRCWVAEESGRIRGHVWIQVIEKVPNPVDEVERHAYLTNMFVEPGLRGRGYGGRLLAEAVRWCREHRVGSVVLWPTEESRPLYVRHGFRATGDLLELPLNPASCGAAVDRDRS